MRGWIGIVLNSHTDTAPDHATARIAGLIYLVVVVTGVFSLAYAPSRLFAGADTAAIVANIGANEQLFRLSMAAELVCYAAFLLLPLALYRLLARVDAGVAAAMVALAAASVPIGIFNVTHHLELLRLVTDSAPLDGEGLARASRALDGYDDGLFVVQVFWGLWLAPFGYLVIRAGFLPRLLGVLLVLACLGYVVDVFGRLVIENFADSGLSPYLRAPRVGEMVICFWLVLFGARRSLFTRKTSP